ncbi:hypothetical protein ASG23_01350 [Cellulomonas sp. Leaf395]|nr:hypothetical protein ASG23_01350 [Cellulomonas sp. Leaf395]
MGPATTVLTAQVVAATPEVANALEFEPHQKVLFLYRVRSADGTPICIEQAWVLVALVPTLFDDGPPASSYEALRERGLAASGARTRCPPTKPPTPRRPSSSSATPAAMFSRACSRADRCSVWVRVRAPRPALVPGR